MRKVMFIIMLSLLLAGCGAEKTLTLNKVAALSQRGEMLDWKDFEDYPSKDIGSGLYILCYEIDENFSLYLGGVPREKPRYMYLKSNADQTKYVDIRTEDVLAFIQSILGE